MANNLDIREIVNQLNGKNITFGPEGTNNQVYYPCMQFDSLKNMLKFNTDLDYKMNGKTEEVIKLLCKKFHIKKYKIEVVIVGELGLDLDFFLDLSEFKKEKIVEIINFIKDSFYTSNRWIYEKHDYRI